ncbi:MAG: DUF502 domain-containing protein [Burkholderiaceae bacterium]|jgi:uncharacterized membrane protein|uniref:DUF502 domain-containing protein n=1 Tax=Polynucleobacter sp. MWH-Loch1C5 TaxID=2689108 RepID=UPI001C0D1B00|nr:DUF502 domain-containing protein [Polynucleobacter sp. MWH-Loch1C5]MBU3542644.1 DUF502 domain-containing protein [Polynucleobacter sp. MWH-Loch1C5]NBV00497.1 DUF502 domain-containing protein [Burkholderiaceae bacterium]
MKKYFIAGILVWAPLAITIWVITWGVSVLDGVFGSIMSAIMAVTPGDTQPTLKSFRAIPGLGVIIVLAIIFVSGLLAANYAGQWWIKLWDRFINRIPIVKSIYSSVKQVSDTLFSSKGNAFRQAVLIPYPRNGSWTIAFVTGNPAQEVANKLKEEHLNVFVPTTPNPTSGFFMIVPKADMIELDMTVEEALKHIVSMGSVPPTQSNSNK